ncbi:hypothetical protein CR513_56364, partial [Mucuna pruriens]
MFSDFCIQICRASFKSLEILGGSASIRFDTNVLVFGYTIWHFTYFDAIFNGGLAYLTSPNYVRNENERFLAVLFTGKVATHSCKQ